MSNGIPKFPFLMSKLKHTCGIIHGWFNFAKVQDHFGNSRNNSKPHLKLPKNCSKLFKNSDSIIGDPTIPPIRKLHYILRWSIKMLRCFFKISPFFDWLKITPSIAKEKEFSSLIPKFVWKSDAVLVAIAIFKSHIKFEPAWLIKNKTQSSCKFPSRLYTVSLRRWRGSK